MRPQPEPNVATATRLSRIVIGYDGSDGATAAAEFGLWLVAEHGGRATLVHAAPTLETAASTDRPTAAAGQAVAYEREWQHRLEALCEDAPDDAVVERRLVRGDPAGALIAAATESSADVILTGSHGTGRLRGAFLGSVSSRVLTHAPCSVLVFRETWGPGVRPRTVVVGVDGSDASRAALAPAQALAATLDATLVLLHAYDPHVPFRAEPTHAIVDQLRRHGRAVLHEARERIAAPLDVVDEELVEGRAGDQLVAACERRAPALLVVGGDGLGGIKELVLGSTSRWAADHARCPVLIARVPGA